MRWATIPEYEDYEVSTTGVVRRCRASSGNNFMGNAGRIMKTRIRARYPAVGLSGQRGRKHFKIAILVLLAFRGPRPTPRHDCCHKDDDQLNSRLGNLRWGTRASNVKDKIRNGKQTRGYHAGPKKFREKQIRHIRQLYASGWTQAEIGEKYDSRQAYISKIVRRDVWGWLR